MTKRMITKASMKFRYMSKDLARTVYVVDEDLGNEVVRSYTLLSPLPGEELVNTMTLKELLERVETEGSTEYLECNDTQLEAIQEELNQITL